MRHDPVRAGQGGFTLLEILVALMIAGLGLAALSGLLSSGMKLSTTSVRIDRETALARSALERFGQDLPVEPGVQTGEMAEGFRWRSEIAIADPSASADAIRAALVTVTVWDKNERDPGVRLTSMRLLPAPRPGGHP